MVRRVSEFDHVCVVSINPKLHVDRLGRKRIRCGLPCHDPYHLSASRPEPGAGVDDHRGSVSKLKQRNDSAAPELIRFQETFIGEPQEFRSFSQVIDEMFILLGFNQRPQLFDIEASIWNAEEKESRT